MNPERGKMDEQENRSTLIQRLTLLDEISVLAMVQERLAHGHDPLLIIEDCQQGMQQVGERYEQQEYFLSGLMMAGEIFREVMEIVQPVLAEQLCGNESGHILLGTVQGDIHDIGKNIFSTMLRCHGFTVTDLGVDVPPAEFVEHACRLRPDVVGLSGLLTLSYEVMRETVALMRRAPDATCSRLPVMVGGGLLNGQLCNLIGADYWAVDAMVGVNLCKQFMASALAR